MARTSAKSNAVGASPPASIAAVAALAGVSIATVSRVVNGVANKASAGTTTRVREAVEALGYRPMGAGRSLRNGRSRLVAVLAANLSNPSMAAMASVAEVALRRADYVMVLSDTHDRPELQDEYLLEMRAQYARGFVLLGAVRSPVLQQLVAGGEPVVFVNRRDPYGDRCNVGIDNHAAGADVARAMAQKGWKCLALIHGSLSSSATAERVEGFLSELARNGARLPASRVVAPASGDHLQIGQLGMKKLLAARQVPDAVFCTSDLIAYGAHRAAAEFDRTADRRIAFIGFDDSPLNEWVAPWLNAVRVPYAEYGNAIVKALECPQEVAVLAHELVFRTA
jgi:LacI family transcriptional regulator